MPSHWLDHLEQRDIYCQNQTNYAKKLPIHKGPFLVVWPEEKVLFTALMKCRMGQEVSFLKAVDMTHLIINNWEQNCLYSK